LTQTHSKSLTTRRKKQKGRKEAARADKQARKLKKQDPNAAAPDAAEKRE
jgi:hypothetical protein